MAPDLEESFNTFVRTRGGHFLRVAVLLTGSVTEAEDLLQASLTQLYRAWPRLGAAESVPDAYLRTILVNTRRSWWRTKWRRELPGRRPCRQRAEPGRRPRRDVRTRRAGPRGPGGAAPAAAGRARAPLRRGPARGITVADLLGVSAGTVKSQAHRGLRALRASLSPPARSRPTNPLVQTVRRGKTNRARGRDGKPAGPGSRHRGRGAAAAHSGVRDQARPARCLGIPRRRITSGPSRNGCGGRCGAAFRGGGGCARWCPRGGGRRPWRGGRAGPDAGGDGCQRPVRARGGDGGGRRRPRR